MSSKCLVLKQSAHDANGGATLVQKLTLMGGHCLPCLAQGPPSHAMDMRMHAYLEIHLKNISSDVCWVRVR